MSLARRCWPAEPPPINPMTAPSSEDSQRPILLPERTDRDRPATFWPGGARLAVTVSMQFEAGGQPLSGAGGPITEPVLPGYPDLGQNSFLRVRSPRGRAPHP